MATAPIFERRRVQLRSTAGEMVESIINGNCNHVVEQIATGRYNPMTRAMLAAYVTAELLSRQHASSAATFMRTIERRAVGEV
jgi:hypothetical protein